MPNSIRSTEITNHLTDILYPIQAYAEVLQTSDKNHASLAGYVLDSLCDDATEKVEKLTQALENKFGALAVTGNVMPEIVQGE